jgi:hypothetical protein
MTDRDGGGTEREIERPNLDPGMRETDDHVAGSAPQGKGQGGEGLDRGIGDEHVSSPSQGVRPVEKSAAGTDELTGGGIAAGGSDLQDDEAAGGGPSGEETGGGGPAFEDEGR